MRQKLSILLSSALLIICIISLQGCIKNEFEISVSLPESVNQTYRVIYYAQDKHGGVTIETALPVTAGKGQLKGITRLPVCAMLFEGASKRPSLIIYARRGDNIKITGPGSNPNAWSVAGNDYNKAITDWRLNHKDDLGSGSPEIINRAVADYVKNHPSDPVSAILLAGLYDRSVDFYGFDRLLASLEGPAADDDILSILGRPEMMVPSEAPANAKPDKSLILQTAATGCDTVRLNNGKPTIMLCRNYDAKDADIMIDTLKSILRQRKDSAQSNVIDLYLSIDSLAWITAIKRDTLHGAVRARAPREFAEPILINLGISTVPWFVVTDKKGNLSYSGNDAAKAAKAFRKLNK